MRGTYNVLVMLLDCCTSLSSLSSMSRSLLFGPVATEHGADTSNKAAKVDGEYGYRQGGFDGQQRTKSNMGAWWGRRSATAMIGSPGARRSEW